MLFPCPCFTTSLGESKQPQMMSFHHEFNPVKAGSFRMILRCKILQVMMLFLMRKKRLKIPLKTLIGKRVPLPTSTRLLQSQVLKVAGKIFPDYSEFI